MACKQKLPGVAPVVVRPSYCNVVHCLLLSTDGICLEMCKNFTNAKNAENLIANSPHVEKLAFNIAENAILQSSGLNILEPISSNDK